MFQQLPAGMRHALRHAPAKLGGKVVNCGSEVRVGLVPVDEFGELLPKALLGVHRSSFLKKK